MSFKTKFTSHAIFNKYSIRQTASTQTHSTKYLTQHGLSTKTVNKNMTTKTNC